MARRLASALGRPVRAGRRPEVSAVLAANREVGAETARVAARLGGTLAVTVLARVQAEVVAAAAAGYAEVVLRPLWKGGAAPTGPPALHRTYVRMTPRQAHGFVAD
jgi:hypothetical protein